MNSKQRVVAALNREQPDRVPTFDWIDEAVILGLAELLGIDIPKRDEAFVTRHGEESDEVMEMQCQVIETLDIDASWLSYSTGLERVTADFGRDKYGRGFMLSDHGLPIVIAPPIKEPADLKGYDMASRISVDDLKSAQYVVDRLPDKAHAMSINGPFQETWLIRGGMDKLMVDYVANPQFAHDCTRVTTELNKRVIEIAAELGFDIIMVDGDLAGNVTSLLSQEHFQEFLKPYKKEIVDHAHQHGLKIVKHCDGVVWPLIDDFVEVGFDGFHPVQPQCMDIGATKAYLTGKACVLGNVDCMDLLVHKTPAEVDRAVKEIINVAAPGGGYICCSSNSLHPGCKPENALAMFKAIKKYGDYADIPQAVEPAAPPSIPARFLEPPPPRRRNRRRQRMAV